MFPTAVLPFLNGQFIGKDDNIAAGLVEANAHLSDAKLGFHEMQKTHLHDQERFYFLPVFGMVSFQVIQQLQPGPNRTYSEVSLAARLVGGFGTVPVSFRHTRRGPDLLN